MEPIESHHIYKPFKRLGWMLALLWLPLFVACYSDVPQNKDIGSFKLEFQGNVKLGDDKSPLPVATGSKPLTLSLKATALGPDGKPDTNYNGRFCLFSDRGILVGSQSPREIKNGVAENIPARLFLAFGKTTIWMTAVTEKSLCPNAANPEDKTIPPVGRVGAAPTLTFGLLSIRDVQAGTESPFDSPLFKKYAVVGSGRMVVTAVSSNGFYTTDIDAYKDGKGYHSLFIFTFSAPTLAYGDGAIPRTLKIGDLVTRVEGGIDEFSGHTQMTFPSFVPKWKKEPGGDIEQVSANEMPKPEQFAVGDTWSRGKMERYESGLVEIKNVVALPVIETQDGWDQFRQWPVLVVEPDPRKNQTQEFCENWVRTELHLHDDASKNGGEYRPCLDKCEAKRKEKNCDPTDQTCIEEANNAWFSCFFQCRFNQQRSGILDRAREKGCTYAILLIQSSATVPEYDPVADKNKNRRFPFIRGILQQVRAGAFFQVTKKQYDSEMSGNGYVIWVRQPSDLGLK